MKRVLREAKDGINGGNNFWDCPTWSKPVCNYTISHKSKKKSEANSNEK